MHHIHTTGRRSLYCEVVLLRIDTGGWSVNCSTLGFRGLCNYPHQLKFNFLLILYVY